MVLAALDDVDIGLGAMVLEGEPGAGKTVLLRSGAGVARKRGWLVLETAPSKTESRLAFTALSDLLDRHVDPLLPKLPAPQGEALETAFLRRQGSSPDMPVEERTIAMATLSVLRMLAADKPMLVAIDDLQWVDASSEAALAFALRRMSDERLVVLATRRVGQGWEEGPGLGRLIGDGAVQRSRLAPLSMAGEHELLRVRLGLDLSRPTLVRLHELSDGNPLFALEIGRELLVLDKEPAIDEPFPVPGSLLDLVQARLQRLSPETRRVLLAVAALAHPTRALLGRLGPGVDSALDEAAAAGIAEVSAGGRARFSHPLYASVHYQQASFCERRDLHSRLSTLVDDVEERARHMALGTSGTDEAVATVLDEAARSASSRGSPQAAAELCDLAARLSPVPSERARRLLASGEHHRQAGHLDLATDRAREALRSQPDAATKARALSVLATVTADNEGLLPGLVLLQQARREAGPFPTLRSDLHHKLAWSYLVGADVRSAQRHAYAMARLAQGVAAQAAAAATLAHVAVMRGKPVPRQLLDQARSLVAAASGERPWTWSETSPAALEGVVLLWAGELEEARAPLQAMYAAALENGDPWLEMHALAYLSSVETSLGAPARGLEMAQRYLTLAGMYGQEAHRSGALWPLAMAEYWLGRTDQARATAQEGLEMAERMGQGLYAIGNLSTLGALDLSLGRAAPAADALARAWSKADRAGVASLGRFPLLADAVEALTEVGREAEAQRVAESLGAIALRLGRPWALALSARGEALIAGGRGQGERAVEAFERALQYHGEQTRALDRARTLLAYGRQQRQAMRKAKARDLLEQAASCFAAVGAGNWADQARSELGRIGGRQGTAEGVLSASELAIAKLVAAGRTNREIAAELHLSAKTVEWNLSKAYRKLGVRSRTELAAALHSRAHAPGEPRGASAQQRE